MKELETKQLSDLVIYFPDILDGSTIIGNAVGPHSYHKDEDLNYKVKIFFGVNKVIELANVFKCVYLDKYEFWWIENGDYPKAYEDTWVSYDIRAYEMETERDDFNAYYYLILARLTLINALSSDGEDDEDEEDITDALAAMYLKMMGTVGDCMLLSAFVENADENMDLDNLRKLSRVNLKKSMDEVLDDHGFSIYKIALSTDEENDQKWWGADNVSRLALEYKDVFFENVMALLGDFSGLEQMVDEIVDVYSCERNSELSSDKADVYDVIYSIKDKMYVKCVILVSDGKSEIKINSKSSTLLSL